MRRRTEFAVAPNPSQIVAAPLAGPESASGAAQAALPAPQYLVRTAGLPIPVLAKPGAVARVPIAADQNPFPIPKDPFPTPVDPFQPVPSPFPPTKNPFPPATNPFAPVTSPGGPGTPVAPIPQPGPPGGNLPVTAAQVGVADVAVNGPAARSTGLSGAGVKVGIISNTFNVLGGAAANVAQGLLPSDGVTVLQEGSSGNDDEGRAMAELIHATAPGAQLYFSTGISTETDFANSVAALQAAGCSVIVDDIGYSDEPMFQNAGPIDTAISNAVAAGVNYFTAVGNNDNAAYQAACAPALVNIPGLGNVNAQTFGGATTQSVTVSAGFPELLSLEWDAPYNASNADSISVDVLSGSTVISTSTQVGGEPVVEVPFPVAVGDTAYSIAITYNSGTPVPGLFKYVLFGGGATINNPSGGQPTGSAYGHTMLPGVNAVGAVNVASTPSQGGAPQPEPFSSTGVSQFLFAPDGTRLAAPEPASAPDFLAPDGAFTSIFQPFDGTSAAAPVAAATAALMLQANPSLDNGDITTLLEDSATPVASSDNAAGAGLIQADLATQFASTGIIAGSPQTVIRGTSAPCTIEGGAGAHWLIAGSGATLIESQGIDSVQAGAGADTVDLTGAQAAVYGSSGPTWVRTLGGDDTVVGGTGQLTVSGGAGGGLIYGSTSGGNMLIAGAQATTILAGGLNDIVAGTGEGDLLYASNAGQSTVIGGAGTEILVGGVGGGAASGGTNVFIAGNGSPLIAPEAGGAVVTFGTGDTTALVGTGSEVLQVMNGEAGGFDVVYNFDPSQDILLLTGFEHEHAAVIAAIANQYDVGGDSWLKLPDGTVLSFVGLDHLAAANVSFG